MGRLFGTDGVRGRANADLTPELALSVAVAAAHTLAEQGLGRPPVAVVGRDPRASGEMLEAAVVAGLASAGATVIRLGVLPTPGVAYLTGEVQADLGVMISASHWVTTTVRLVALAPDVEVWVPTLITCSWVKIVLDATLPAVETVAMTLM